MTCASCGTESSSGAAYCKECGVPLVPPGTGPEAQPADGEKPAALAVVLSIAWERKGPILMALFVVLMIAMVFAPWAFLKLDVLGFELASNTYSGWDLIIPRILFYCSVLPLAISLLMVAGVGTRRRSIETHLCTFFAGIIFTVWVAMFGITMVLKSVLKNVRVLEVNFAGAQVVMAFLLLGFFVALVITAFDRNRWLETMEKEAAAGRKPGGIANDG